MSEQGQAPPPSNAQEVRVEIARWASAEALVMPVRLAVFVVEQGVPEDIERDAFDAVSLHAIARDPAGAVVATGRLLPDGHVGRMAVVPPLRGKGVGGAVLEALVAEAVRAGLAEVALNAQVHALAFYHRHGFVEYGDVFMEAGIPHRAMRRALVPCR